MAYLHIKFDDSSLGRFRDTTGASNI